MTPLRILIVCRSTVHHQDFGGMERVGAGLAATLRDAGHEIGLLTTVGPSVEALLQDYDHAWRVPGSRPGRYSLTWWRALMRDGEWDRWEPQLVISVGDGGGPLAWRRNRRYAFAMQVHATPTDAVRSALQVRSAKTFFRVALNVARIPSRALFFRCSDELWPVGDEVAAELVRLPYRVRRRKVRTIRNGVDPAQFRFSSDLRSSLRTALSLEPLRSVGLTVGRLHRQKGVDLAIEATALQPEGRHLLVVGDGPERVRLEELCARREVGHRVTFLGWLDPDGVKAAMSAADTLLFPTRCVEGLPLVVLEAIAAGLRVVATATARVPAALEDLTTTCAPTARELSSAWASTVATPRGSGLPAGFTSTASGDALCEAVHRVAVERHAGGFGHNRPGATRPRRGVADA